MAGERVLVVDSASSIQDIAKAVLEEHGYKVVTAGNALAAINHPDLPTFQAVLVDCSMEGIDGLETAAEIRTQADTFDVPVLLLVEESQLNDRSNQSLRGANGYLAKPFTPHQLAVKVHEVIEEQKIRETSRRYLEESADRHMQTLAEQKIQSAVEKKIQIIVERAIQSIVSIIDQRARREVDARVTALAAEKEQELVRQTVQEVAKSLIDKMAEKKVTDAMEIILAEQTEKTVKRAADAALPQMVRDRLKESLDSMLPREVQAKTDKAITDKMTELVDAMVQILSQEARKTVPLVAKEKLPDIAERQVAVACEQRIPALVAQEARGAVAAELTQKIAPFVEAESKKFRQKVYLAVGFLGVTTLLSVGITVYLLVTQ